MRKRKNGTKYRNHPLPHIFHGYADGQHISYRQPLGNMSCYFTYLPQGKKCLNFSYGRNVTLGHPSMSKREACNSIGKYHNFTTEKCS
jgi:hypothetical protein